MIESQNKLLPHIYVLENSFGLESFANVKVFSVLIRDKAALTSNFVSQALALAYLLNK